MNQRRYQLPIIYTVLLTCCFLPPTLGLSAPTRLHFRYGSSTVCTGSTATTSIINHRTTTSYIRPSTQLFQKGDPFRESSGIRPSLHPTTINAIADALRSRARQVEGMKFRVSETVKPLDVALTAGKIASSAVLKRQETSEQDGMKLTEQEEQTIAGRILGVIMRFDDLESTLYQRVASVPWVQKYNEWNTFGVVPSEDEDDTKVEERIKDDPLFAVTRAECLLALFLSTVEIPQLQKVGESVPDGSRIDFLDADRREVLIGEDS